MQPLFKNLSKIVLYLHTRLFYTWNRLTDLRRGGENWNRLAKGHTCVYAQTNHVVKAR